LSDDLRAAPLVARQGLLGPRPRPTAEEVRPHMAPVQLTSGFVPLRPKADQLD
jgi:hypothetical protein